ncbi:sugar phosphate isomerase/epimerase [Spirosoma knui]
MNKLGMNLFVWTTTMDEDLSRTFLFLKEQGFDFVEMPINESGENPDFLVKWQRVGQQLSELGLGVQTCTICGPEYCLINPDETIRQAGITYLKRVVDCTAAAGGTILMGPLYAGFKTFTGQPATEEEWGRSVAAMREVAEHAQERNVTLAIEYLNRFETYLLTCTDDLVRYVEAVDHPNCRAAFDTFHANIEEKSMASALRKLAPYLVHIQISENDRSTPGQGQINFDRVFDALQEIGYEGPIAIEAFGMNPPEIAQAAHIFRPMFDSAEQLAADGLTFLKSELANRTVAEAERTSAAAVDV